MFHKPREPIQSIDTNITRVPIIIAPNNSAVGINFTEYLVKRPRFYEDISFDNFTEKLVKEEEYIKSLKEEPYIPF